MWQLAGLTDPHVDLQEQQCIKASCQSFIYVYAGPVVHHSRLESIV